MVQKATIEAMRALAYVTAASLDFAARHPDEKERKRHKALYRTHDSGREGMVH